ncbi:MAG: SpoIIE family protein phosphatase [Acidimicrobiia bacterium]|nr:SpoIIE family protein phosphatase [Acidimicrobiia bacterium]
MTVPAASRTAGLRTRLTLVVGGAIAAVSVMVLIIAPIVGELRRETRYAGTVIAQVEQDVAALQAAAIDQETGERGFLLTRREEFLAPYEAGRVEADRRIEALRASSIEGLPDAVAEVDHALERWRVEAVEPEIALAAAGRDPGPLILQGEGRRLFDEVRTQLEALGSTVRAESEAARDRIDLTLRHLVTALLVVYGFGATVCLAVWRLLRRWITVPVERLLGEVERVSAGDFEHPIRIAGTSELVAVAAATDRMRHEIVDRLQEANRAREALEQRAPAVVALREELEPPTPTLPPGLEVVTRFDPVEGLLAGDFSDVLVLGDGRVAIVVADASGHGAPVVVRALRAKHLLSAALVSGRSPADAFALVAPQIGEGAGWFVSAMVLVVAADGTVTWAGAGHPAAMVRTPSSPEIVELASTGPVLGPVPGPWEQRTARFPVPWLALVVTDGVLEARDPQRRMFGEEPLRARLAALDPAGPGAPALLVSDLGEELRRFLGGQRPTDDVTLSAVRVGGRAPAGAGSPT